MSSNDFHALKIEFYSQYRRNSPELYKVVQQLKDIGWYPQVVESGVPELKPIGYIEEKRDPKHLKHMLAYGCILQEGGDEFCDYSNPSVHYVTYAPEKERGDDKWAIPMCDHHIKDMERLLLQFGDARTYFDIKGVDPLQFARDRYDETVQFRAGVRKSHKVELEEVVVEDYATKKRKRK